MNRNRMVVVGGGIAGLVAAAAAANQFDEVVVIDRDDQPAGRAGGHPHRAQLHNILTRGQWHLEELLPGFRTAFLAAGGAEGDVASDTHVHEFGGDGTERSLGLSIWSAPWQTVWKVAQGLLSPNVQLRHGTAVDGLEVEDRRVSGVRFTTANGSEAVDADAVVDASGHGSPFERLLPQVGAKAPRVEHQRLDRWFVTIRLRRPPAMVGRPDFWMIFAEPPHREVALISPHGADGWLLSVSSQEPSSTPPLGFEGILAFVDGLPGSSLRPVLEDAAPLGSPSTFRRREAHWHHYEEIEAPLAGFAPLGDAFASINPVFGQGVGVAAWQASVLRAALTAEAEAPAWTRAYLRSAGEVVAHAWALDDIPSSHVPLSDWIALGRGLAEDVDLHRRYVGLWHLVEPASSLSDLVALARTSASSRFEGPP